MAISWLPPLVTFAEYGGNWDAYLQAIYGHFCQDFHCTPPPEFNGTTVRLKRHPMEAGKEATFWHFVSTGATEADRDIDLRRCERIRWPRALMDNVLDPELLVWDEPRGSEIRTHILCEEHRYLLVVANRSGFVLPWTGYPLDHANQVDKLIKRWKAYT